MKLTLAYAPPLIVACDFEPIRKAVKKKAMRNAQDATRWIWQKVRGRIRRSSNKKQVLPVEQKIYYWDRRSGDYIRSTRDPVEFMKGKKAVVAFGGRGGRVALKPDEIFDMGTRRFNKASKPGDGPISHPSDVPGWKDEWLKHAIYSETLADGTIHVYVDLQAGGRKGPRAREIVNALEFGGVTKKFRKWQDGYKVAKVRSGYKTERGDGMQVWGGSDYRKNRSGRTLRAHKRKFSVPHVQLHRHYHVPKWATMATHTQPRPFMRPIEKWFWDTYFPRLDYSPED